ncbi:MAG: ParB/RepB/Spo0J family partition protein [bacterium]|nr:ParB/RepB/Spo0J family partition protein [bacterium]
MQPNQSPDPIFHIETDKISPNPYQPRRYFDETALEELASSIREFGLLHPIVVTKIENASELGTTVSYQLIAGERRLMAAKKVGLERVPAIVKNIPTDRQRLELAIIENIQRENLNPIETARAYAKLQDQFGMTQREVAVRMGKSRESVTNAMRLLNLPSHIQDAVAETKVSESQARLLLMISDFQEQQAVFDDLIRNNLSVRELRTRIQGNRPPRVDSIIPQSIDPEVQQVEDQLREVLGTAVKLHKEHDGGKLTINFYSEEELQGLIQKLVSIQHAPSQAPEALPQLPENKEDFSV